MKIKRQSSHLILALLILTGMMSASLHQLRDNVPAVDDASQCEIVQDHNYCAICGSLFKFTSQSDFSSEIILVSESSLFSVPDLVTTIPATELKNPRAPPVS